MLAAENLTLQLGKAEVLRALTACFQPGTITAICGPNGAGKSSLLAALAGLIEPAAGRVTLDGQALGRLFPRQRAQAIGYLPQLSEVHWDVSVRSLVMLGRLPHGDHNPEAVDGAIAACALEHVADRPLSTLSGGTRARALLARVLAGEPRWILADEPLAALDLGHQLALLGRLKDQAAQGTGVVLVVHDLSLAMNHAGRVLVLDGGAVAADGPPDLALSAEIIARVWQVSARWLGDPGARALVVDRPLDAREHLRNRIDP